MLRPGALFLSLMIVLVGPAAAQDDVGWPRSIADDRGEVVMYQPQVESFAGNRLEARAAVSVKLKDQKAPVFGALWFDARLATDMDTRTATLEQVTVTAARFPEADTGMVDKLSRFLEQEIPTWDLVLSIDRLVASLPDAAGADKLQAGSPVFHHRTAPAVLVLVDGDPVFADLEGADLQYVANTAYFIVRQPKGRLYLRGSGMWFAADDLGGPWGVTTDLPADVAAVSARIEQEEAEQAAAEAKDAQTLGVKADGDEAAPEIIVSTVPAELIVTDGAPDLAPVPGADLLYVRNTESDVLVDIAAQQHYTLAAGRWFRAASLDEAEWTFVPFEELPEAFARIPADSDVASVLPSVPGTDQAREALLETQIPQTAEVDRRSATCSVQYDGDPEFEVCADNDVAYARNSDKPVLLIDRRYYCVDDAVWFEADAAGGPWKVCVQVPAAVQDIPPECPVYNVKYVYVYDSTPDVVYVGYTSGYYGAYAWGPCAVWGTGWYYPYWWRHYYYPRPVTYGFGVHYNPYTGWGFSFGVSYGWLTVGVGWARPYPAYWGPGGYRYGYRHGYWHGYNHGYARGWHHGAAAGYRAGYRAAQANRPENLYRDRRDGVKRTGDVRRDGGKRPARADRANDVYVDRDGKVMRDRDGQWEERKDGRWEGSEGKDADRDRKRDDRDTRERDQDRKPEDRDTRERDRQRDEAARDRQQKDSRDRAAPPQRDRSEQVRPDRGDSRQQLDRDRQQRSRGAERQRQAPQRSAPQRGGARRR